MSLSKAKLLVEYLDRCGLENIEIKGKNIMASCPFAAIRHKNGEDRDPSWGMLISTGQYRCFSCLAKGNLYTLAKKLGFPLFDLDSLPDESYKTLKEKFIETMRKKMHSFSKHTQIEYALPYEYATFSFDCPQNLWAKNEQKAREWLQNEKGYADQTLKTFAIGYNKITGNPMFPFTDDKGYVVGWQERNLDHPQKGPKYKNKSNFHKGDYLYNYCGAKKAGECIVVEAVLSVLKLHEMNLLAVSSAGAALTDTQLGKLGTLTEITLCFDNDMTGIMTLNKTLQALEKSLCKLYWTIPPKNTKVHKMEKSEILAMLSNKRTYSDLYKTQIVPIKK